MAETIFDLKVLITQERKAQVSQEGITELILEKIKVSPRRRRELPALEKPVAATKSDEVELVSLPIRDIAAGYREVLQEYLSILSMLKQRIGTKLSAPLGSGKVAAAAQSVFKKDMEVLTYTNYVDALILRASLSSSLAASHNDQTQDDNKILYMNLSIIVEAYEKFLDRQMLVSGQRAYAADAKGTAILVKNMATADATAVMAETISAAQAAATEVTTVATEAATTVTETTQAVAQVVDTIPDPLPLGVGFLNGITDDIRASTNESLARGKEIARTTTVSEPDTLESLYNGSNEILKVPSALSNIFNRDQKTYTNPDGSLFQDIRNCVPCRQMWDWGEIDLSKISDLLEADLASRFGWVDSFKNMLSGNEVLQELCNLLEMFQDLCPQDITNIIAAITTFIYKLLSGWEFSIGSIIKELLSQIMKPYVSGLMSLLDSFFQIMMSQADCILTLINSGAKELQKASFYGKKLISDDDKNAKLFLSKTESTSASLKKIIEEPSETLNNAVDKFTSFNASSFMSELGLMYASSLEWIEAKTKEMRQNMADFFVADWLVSDKSIDIQTQLRKAGTFLDILDTLKALGNLKERCSTPEGTRELISIFNDRIPDVVVIVDIDLPITLPDSSGSTTIQQPTTNTTTPITFSATECFRRRLSERDQIDQYILELSR